MAIMQRPAKGAGGRPKGSPNKSTAEMREMISRICGDPLEGMAKVALGDVVALGWMTKKELEEKPTFDARGRVVRPSGMERALSYLPPDLRAKMYSELAQYCYAKRRSIVVEDSDGNPMGGAGLVLYMPHNGRDEPSQPITVRRAPRPQ